MRSGNRQPRGELSLRTVAMQANGPAGSDVFGGWIMYWMNEAVLLAARARAAGQVATASVSNMQYVQAVKPGDVVFVYTNITRVGRTSITCEVDVYATRQPQGRSFHVTAAEFVVVAVDDQRMPRILPAAA
jgi:acyl-CoA thioesterase YciA